MQSFHFYTVKFMKLSLYDLFFPFVTSVFSILLKKSLPCQSKTNILQNFLVKYLCFPHVIFIILELIFAYVMKSKFDIILTGNFFQNHLLNKLSLSHQYEKHLYLILNLFSNQTCQVVHYILSVYSYSS